MCSIKQIKIFEIRYFKSKAEDFDRMSSEAPMNDALGRVTKKIRKRPNEPPDPDDPVVYGQGMLVDSREQSTTSWRDKLLGSTSNNDPLQKDDDISKEVIDGVPSIMFSERAHDFIAQLMYKTLIVKLLG